MNFSTIKQISNEITNPIKKYFIKYKHKGKTFYINSRCMLVEKSKKGASAIPYFDTLETAEHVKEIFLGLNLLTSKEKNKIKIYSTTLPENRWNKLKNNNLDFDFAIGEIPRNINDVNLDQASMYNLLLKLWT